MCFRYFSKFISEGAIRIELTLDDSEMINKNNLDYVAFYNEKIRQTVLVILNEHETDINLSVFDPEQSKFLNVLCEKHSIRTVVWFN